MRSPSGRVFIAAESENKRCEDTILLRTHEGWKLEHGVDAPKTLLEQCSPGLFHLSSLSRAAAIAARPLSHGCSCTAASAVGASAKPEPPLPLNALIEADRVSPLR
jgi:hypothetical protein